MYYDWKDFLRGLIAGFAYAVAALAVVFAASLVWHFGEICMRGWL